MVKLYHFFPILNGEREERVTSNGDNKYTHPTEDKERNHDRPGHVVVGGEAIFLVYCFLRVSMEVWEWSDAGMRS
jgi:hypothetical protein